MSPNVLTLEHLGVELASGDRIIRGIDLQIRQGEIVGLVGESGSGKTTMALALLGYSADGVHIVEGHLNLSGDDVAMDDSMRSRRGSQISYVPQDPAKALNPALTIDRALRDVAMSHAGGRLDSWNAGGHLASVGLPDAETFARRLPHQISGGQQQRVCIAMALSCEPALVVLDEPTTGLDVVSQAKIIERLRQLRDEHNVAMVYVTHDLAVIAQIADRVAVMYAGRIVEEGPTAELLSRPRHPYTRDLLAASPDHLTPRRLEPIPGIAAGVDAPVVGCTFAPRCPLAVEHCLEETPPTKTMSDNHRVACFRWSDTPALTVSVAVEDLTRRSDRPDSAPLLTVFDLSLEHRSKSGRTIAADGVSFTIPRGSSVALVGESGSGKTTIARAIVGLHRPSGGTIQLDSEPLAATVRQRTLDQRRRIQMVFQNPGDSLNPRRTVGDQIARSAQLLRGVSGPELAAETNRLLERVRLRPSLGDRYPSELSGGERQRVSIARALAANPELIICDEVTSALDVSVQAAVLALLDELKKSNDLSLLFITHDLGVVANVADDVLVLERGRLRECGPTAKLLRNPEHPYTQSLLAAAPSISAAVATTRLDH